MTGNVTPAQFKSARQLLGMSQSEVGNMFGRSDNGVGDAERGRAGRTTIARLVAFYEANGIEFLTDDRVRLKQDGKGV